MNYARYVNNELLDNDIRTQLDDRNEKMGYKMRQGILKKIPMTFVVGEKELNNGTISYRDLKEKEIHTEPKNQVVEYVKTLAQNPAKQFRRK